MRLLKRFKKTESIPALIRNNSDDQLDDSKSSNSNFLSDWKRRHNESRKKQNNVTMTVTPSPEKRDARKKKNLNEKDTIGYMNSTRSRLTYTLSNDKLPAISSIREDESTVSSSSTYQDGIERFFHKHTASTRDVHGRSSGKRRRETKIFILLIQPRSKKFELIEVMFSTKEATLGDILRLIPSNATDDALGQQPHVGLCRPTDGIEMTDQLTLVRGRNSFYRIQRGEILIAIPNGYSGKKCQQMALSILNHPALSRLLQNANPLSTSNPNPRQSSQRPPLIHTHIPSPHTSRPSHRSSRKSRSSHKSSRTSRQIHFEIESNLQINAGSHNVPQLSDHTSTNGSVASNATGRSFFSSFLENERLYYQQHLNQHSNANKNMDDMNSVATILSKVPKAMEKTISQAIGTMTQFLAQVVAPQDSHPDHQPYTRAIIRRPKGKLASIDPVNSLKVFAAFLTFIMTRQFTKSTHAISSASTSITTSSTLLCAGVMVMLKRFSTVVQRSRQDHIHAKSKQRMALETIMGKDSSSQF